MGNEISKDDVLEILDMVRGLREALAATLERVERLESEQRTIEARIGANVSLFLIAELEKRK